LVCVSSWLGKGVDRWWVAAFCAAILLLLTLSLASSALARPGSLDRGFGVNGLVVEDLESGGPWPGAVVVQSDGRAVVGTGSQIVRFRGDGARDSSFAARSLPLTDLVGLPGDRLMRLGDDELERMLPDGARDPGFARASGGTASASGIELVAIAADPEERIVAVGHDANTGALAVTRFLPDGQLDLGFGSGGVVRTAISAPGPTNLDIGRSVSVGADGKILVGGSAGSEEDCTGALHCWGPYLNALVLRYLPDGTLDRSFARDGIFVAEGGGWGSAESVVPRADGGLLFLPGPPTGALEAGYQFPLAVVALTPQGQRDGSFSRDGIGAWVPRVHGKRANYKGATRMLVTPRGQIVACGWIARSEYRPSRFWVGLLRADGRPARFFGSNGSARTPMPTRRDGYAASLALGPGGTVYLAGSLGPDLALARYHLN
jgi:uncharacterized delta-60 repeat protein